MIDLIKEAVNVQTVCEKNNWSFCFIGGIALQFLGERRLTEDIDLNILTGFGNEEIFIQTLLQNYSCRIADCQTFALQRRILLVKAKNGIELDIALGALPFEESLAHRAIYVEFDSDIRLKICTAEDLIVMKAFADRTRDWADIETVLIKQDNLDWNYIYEHLTPLAELKYAPEILSRLEKTREKYYQK